MSTNIPSVTSLQCQQCGNDARFYEVMEHVENLVDGRGNHLHLLIAEPAYFQCVECGAEMMAEK